MFQHISEKFRKNPNIESDAADISIRNFQITQNRIFLQFHYGNDAITATTKIYLKPPPPDYGCEIIYDPNCVIEYNVINYCNVISVTLLYLKISIICFFFVQRQVQQQRQLHKWNNIYYYWNN